MSDMQQSRLSEEMYETVQGLYACGTIDKRRFEQYQALHAACQTPKYTGEDVKELRSRLNVSQSVLARLINASDAAVRAWEAGVKKPSGPSNKLLQLLDQKGLSLFF